MDFTASTCTDESNGSVLGPSQFQEDPCLVADVETSNYLPFLWLPLCVLRNNLSVDKKNQQLKKIVVISY